MSADSEDEITREEITSLTEGLHFVPLDHRLRTVMESCVEGGTKGNVPSRQLVKAGISFAVNIRLNGYSTAINCGPLTLGLGPFCSSPKAFVRSFYMKMGIGDHVACHLVE